MKVVSVRPYYSPDPSGPTYEQYWQQRLMLHVLFRNIIKLKGMCETSSEAYTVFLQSTNIPASLEDDINVVTPTGVAVYYVHGRILHSLCYLPTKGEFKDLQETFLISYSNR